MNLTRQSFTQTRPAAGRAERGFTLLEVMIASAIFAICMFAIMELSTSSLRMAESIRRSFVDPSMVAAEISSWEELEEGSESGDFGDEAPNADWVADISEYSEDTEHLYFVEIQVRERVGRNTIVSRMELVLFRPPEDGAQRRGFQSQGGLRPRGR